MRVYRLVTVNSVEERILARAHYKLGLDKKIIEAGMFNKKSNAKERKSMLEEIMRQEEEAKDLGDEDIPNDKQINEMLARTREEFDLFQKMDKERMERDRIEAKLNGRKEPLPRLMADDELPEWLRVDNVLLDEDPTSYGRGHRRKGAPVSYHDGLTESQWEKLLEEGGTEQDIARMREKNLNRKNKRMAESLDAEEGEEEEEPPQPLRKRSRKENAPPSSREKEKEHRSNKPRKGSAVQEKMKLIWEAIATSREAETGRQRSKLFMRLPSKKLYPDYYEIIRKPISLNNIKGNIEKGGYTPQLFKEEFDRMFNNAQQYNIAGSEVFVDAVFLQKLFHVHWEQNLGSNGGSRETEGGKEDSNGSRYEGADDDTPSKVSDRKASKKRSRTEENSQEAGAQGRRRSAAAASCFPLSIRLKVPHQTTTDSEDVDDSSNQENGDEGEEILDVEEEIIEEEEYDSLGVED